MALAWIDIGMLIWLIEGVQIDLALQPLCLRTQNGLCHVGSTRLRGRSPPSDATASKEAEHWTKIDVTHRVPSKRSDSGLECGPEQEHYRL